LTQFPGHESGVGSSKSLPISFRVYQLTFLSIPCLSIVFFLLNLYPDNGIEALSGFSFYYSDRSVRVCNSRIRQDSVLGTCQHGSLLFLRLCSPHTTAGLLCMASELIKPTDPAWRHRNLKHSGQGFKRRGLGSRRFFGIAGVYGVPSVWKEIRR
jgi:hypothetical protein